MAKKKSRSRPLKKVAAKRVASSARTRKPGARSQALPGMEQIRNVRLDHACEGIAETRSNMNALRLDERSDMQAALAEMHTKGLTSYHHGGVELVRVPGAEKLRVRTVKEPATGQTDEPTDAQIDAVDNRYDAEEAEQA